mgnify:CR=1 FL=1
MVTYDSIRQNAAVNTYIEEADHALGALGYTEHSFAHVTHVAKTAGDLLTKLGYDAHTTELARIAGYLHDIGNLVNRVDHSQSGAIMAFRLLDKMGMDARDIAAVVSAIGNHDEGTGVPISAIIFGGRRAKTAPLVYQSRDWAHGVFVGATMASETTAAATGAVGVVRRDPMAMRPFCGYNMADYWQDMGEKLPNAPKIFNVNWFRTDDNGRFLWPGFGDNLRVLEWILKRCFDEVGADETVIGYEPKPEDINLDGSGVTVETLRELLTLDAESWRENCAGIREYFAQFGDKLPHELRAELEALEKAFAE